MIIIIIIVTNGSTENIFFIHDEYFLIAICPVGIIHDEWVSLFLQY